MELTKKRAITNHDTGLLGILAVICMLFDHTGAAFFPGRAYLWMRVIGRVAFPLFAWGIAIGAEHTRSMGRYALRLLVLAVISQPFFMFGLNHSIDQLNIFATLFLGLIGIWGLKEKREWMTVAAVLIASMITMDYGLRGVLLILMFWVLRNNPLALAVCYGAFCVKVWGIGGQAVWTTPYFTVTLQSCAFLALPLMLIPKATRTRTPRGLMYAIYPGHLAVIWLLKEVLK